MDSQPDDGPTTPEYHPPTADEVVGRVLSNFRVLSLIGAGGMGRVYEAEHIRLGRRCAIKVLNRDLAVDEQNVARFFREARAVNDIGHPNIVDISDFVEKRTEDPPLVYMVMELLKGQDLRQRIKEVGVLAPGEAVAIALEITEALIAAHEHQILHRDLKPENIFLERQAGGKIRIRLLDFGLAKVLKRGKTANTNPEVAVGTPQYMAPEQILEQPLDARTDIYALGVVLYHMLAGRVPFDSKVYSAVLMRHVQDQPPPIAEHRGEPVPPGLDAVVMCCLEKKAGNRFKSAKALRDALRVGLLEEAVPTLVVPKTRPKRGRSVSLVVVALLAVLGVGGGVLVGWLSGFGAEVPDAPSVVSIRPLNPSPQVDARPPDARPVVHQPHPDAAPVVAIKKPKRPQRRKPKTKTKTKTKTKRREPKQIHGLIDPFAK